MSETIDPLISILKNYELSIRTGVLLMPVYALGHESEVAAILGIGHADICSLVARQIPDGRSSLGLSCSVIIEALTTIVSDTSLPGNCILVSGVDVLLCGVPEQERIHFWSFFRNNFRRDRGILICIPKDAANIFSYEERLAWKAIDRIRTWATEEK